MLYIFLPVLFLFGFSSHLQASNLNVGFGVDPYVGFQPSTTLSSYDSKTRTIDPELSGCGFVFGTRAIATYSNFFLGVDVSYVPLIVQENSVSNTLKGANSNFKLGFVLGLELAVLPLSTWVGYNFIETLDLPQYAGVNAPRTYNGSSLKIGAGYLLMPYLKLNAEYAFVGYGSYQDKSGTVITKTKSTSTMGYYGNTFLLSVSAPIPFEL